MKSTAQFIETLEPRIAPALLVNGGNLLGGTGNPTTGETSTGANTVTLVKVLSGQALVFYNNGEITGISVGQHTKLDITGDVNGDIVTNLDANGRLSDSDHNPLNGEDGNILNSYGIKGITTHPLGDEKGSIGRIIAGGQISNVNVSGELAGIYAGNGIFRNGDTAQVTTSGIDTNSVQTGIQDTFTFDSHTSVPNGNSAIKNVTVNTARQLEIFAGSGVDGSQAGMGGSAITNVTITKTLAAAGAKPVVFLHSGDGGAGVDSGGYGGAITSFNDQGSIAYVKLQTGNGGSASGGTGGVGGSLLTSTIVSSSTRYDFILGSGGDGLTGGVGGSIKTLTFTNNITGGTSLIATADLNHDGLPDVVFVNALTGEPIVSLGTANPAHPGEANFQVAVQTVTQADGTTVQTPFLPAEGANPTSLVVTDLNGDGYADFAVSYASTNTLGVYLNDQHGGFTASAVNLNTLSPTRIVAGDFTANGVADLAIVSAAATTTAQAGLSSEVFIAANDGTGHFTVGATPAAILPGTATDAAAAPVYDATGTALVGANLFVGFKNGGIDPVFFRAGTATVEQTIDAFITNNGVATNAAITSVDAVPNGTTDLLLAYTKDVNAAQEATGNTTVTATPLVKVFSVDTGGQASNTFTFNPDPTTTKVAFFAGTDLIGTVAPAALTLWGVVERNYETITSLGSDGNLSDFAATHTNGTYQIAASGSANNRFFFTTGDPEAANGISPFLPSETPFEPRLITFATGDGGNGDSLAGGNAGSINHLTYTQALDGGVQMAGGSYNTVLSTGHGGSSNGSVGGNGGEIHDAALSLSPSFLTYSDDTSTAEFLTGAGGQGATGGSGGSISKASTTSVFMETAPNSSVYLDSVAVRMQTGDGGVGTAAKGGDGGSITLAGPAAFSGVTFVDDDSSSAGEAGLLVKTGNGGNGVTQGGNGGSLTNVGTQNAAIGSLNLKFNELASALLVSGNGGDASNGYGGAAGDITGTNVATQQALLAVVINNLQELVTTKDGSVTVVSGNGGSGHGGGGGGRGGLIENSTIASVNSDPTSGYGVLVKGGVGGDGDISGGAGGTLKHLNINGPADPSLYDAVVVAGHGGNALSNGPGGKGGGVQSLVQNKDVNSAINIIQAGDGGTGAGDIGGVGGNVKSITAAGFIGLPSTETANLGAFHDVDSALTTVAGLFASADVPQGIYAGVGADGAVNGSVLNVVARQIAAIGATVQANGHFAVANVVDNISADLIGYQVNRGRTNFQSADGSSTSPASAVPIDGFILATTVTNINTEDNNRTGLFTFNG